MNQKNENISVRYDQAAITHTSQFIISPSHEELILDLSSGLIQAAEGDQLLPIHTRLALPWSTVERLARLLNQVVDQRKQAIAKSTQKPASAPAAPTMPQATLPQLTNVNE
jgi:hypothetical protein